MTKQLTNYADWSEIFDQIEEWEIGHTDTTNITNLIKNGSINWVSGIAERFSARLLTLINNRLNKLEQFYSKRLSVCYDHFSISNLLIQFRKELIFLKELASIKALPENVREDIVNLVVSYAQNVHKDLLNNSKRDLSGQLKQIILGVKIDNI